MSNHTLLILLIITIHYSRLQKVVVDTTEACVRSVVEKVPTVFTYWPRFFRIVNETSNDLLYIILKVNKVLTIIQIKNYRFQFQLLHELTHVQQTVLPLCVIHSGEWYSHASHLTGLFYIIIITIQSFSGFIQNHLASIHTQETANN